MSNHRPFRFGIQASRAGSAREWVEIVRKVEDLGYSTLTMADHLDDQLAPGPALALAAAVTTDLRLGTLVYCNDYRHPVVLAKEVATLDLLSEGRFEFGLGAGWMVTDYEGAGIPLDRPGVRIDRMLESLQIVRGLLGGEPVHFHGEHYGIYGLTGFPPPVQRPMPPLVIGGGGRRVLSIAAREADIVGVNVNLRGGVIDATAGSDGTPERTDEKIAWIREAAGERMADIELQVRVHLTVVTDDRLATAEGLAAGFGMTVEQALGSPFALAGTVDQICEDLIARRQRWGFSYIGLGLEALDDMAPVVARLAGT